MPFPTIPIVADSVRAGKPRGKCETIGGENGKGDVVSDRDVQCCWKSCTYRQKNASAITSRCRSGSVAGGTLCGESGDALEVWKASRPIELAESSRWRAISALLPTRSSSVCRRKRHTTPALGRYDAAGGGGGEEVARSEREGGEVLSEDVAAEGEIVDETQTPRMGRRRRAKPLQVAAIEPSSNNLPAIHELSPRAPFCFVSDASLAMMMSSMPSLLPYFISTIKPHIPAQRHSQLRTSLAICLPTNLSETLCPTCIVTHEQGVSRCYPDRKTNRSLPIALM